MHPELIQTAYFTLNTLWIFFAIGIIITVYLIIKLSEINSLKIQFLSDHSWKLILWSIIGARIFEIIQNTDTFFYEWSYKTFLQIFYIWDKGLDLTGAMIAATIFLFYQCKKNEQDFFKWLDILAPAVIAGLAIGHIGAFFEGINYGHETSLPWGVNFESPAIKYTVPIHPTQIYAFLYSAIIATASIIFSQTEKIQKIQKSGLIGLSATFLYGLMMFLENFVRGDDTLMIFGIRLPQIMASILIILTGIAIFKKFLIKTKPTRLKRTTVASTIQP